MDGIDLICEIIIKIYFLNNCVLKILQNYKWKIAISLLTKRLKKLIIIYHLIGVFNFHIDIFSLVDFGFVNTYYREKASQKKILPTFILDKIK